MSLDVALTRLAALAEEASNQGRWSSGLDVMAEICGACKDALKAWLAPIPRQAPNA